MKHLLLDEMYKLYRTDEWLDERTDWTMNYILY